MGVPELSSVLFSWAPGQHHPQTDQGCGLQAAGGPAGLIGTFQGPLKLLVPRRRLRNSLGTDLRDVPS